MIGTKNAIIGTILIGFLLAGAYYKYQYEKSIEELAEVKIARDSAIEQLNLLANGYAEQVKKVNDYQERISIITKANVKINSELESYKARVSALTIPEAEIESNKKTESILKGLR
jgi:hypothetical protein